MDGNVFTALDRVLAAAVRDEPALIEARDQWYRLAGQVHDDEPLYEERAAGFIDWFALERPDAEGHTPVEKMLAGAAPEERAAYIALTASHRSIFRVMERYDGGLVIEDLWGGATFRARERRALVGVEAGDLLDARVAADAEAPPAILLLRIVCVHPREVEQAVRALVGEAKTGGEGKDKLLFRLLRLRIKCERYQHVSPVRVYAAGDAAIRR